MPLPLAAGANCFTKTAEDVANRTLKRACKTRLFRCGEDRRAHHRPYMSLWCFHDTRWCSKTLATVYKLVYNSNITWVYGNDGYSIVNYSSKALLPATDPYALWECAWTPKKTAPKYNLRRCLVVIYLTRRNALAHLASCFFGVDKKAGNDILQCCRGT